MRTHANAHHQHRRPQVTCDMVTLSDVIKERGIK